MAGQPNNVGGSGGGARQERAAQMREEMESQQQPQAGAAGDEPQAPEQSQEADDQARQQDATPCGSGEHVVQEGDCISSIAKGSGHLWETIWNDPGNAQLQEARQDPNVLLPDDRVTVPPIRKKDESGESEMRHRFVRRGEPAYMRVQVLDDDRPLAGQPYKLQVDQNSFTGTTDAQGQLDVPIPGNANRATLEVGVEPNVFKYELDLGEIEPVEGVRGVQQRLANLGFGKLAVDGIVGPHTAEALKAFQRLNELQETGEADAQTRQRLRDRHGS